MNNEHHFLAFLCFEENIMICIVVTATDPAVGINYLTSGVAGVAMNWQAKEHGHTLVLAFKVRNDSRK